jgi:thiol-disulfide isomerase/thioredoxin
MKSMTKIGTLMAMLLAAGCSSKAASETSTDSGTEGGSVDASDDADADDASGCVYPSGPYGTDVGKVIDPSYVWQGFVPGSSTVSTIKITDLYDCDGSKGINAIVLDDGAQWCVACQSIAPYVPTWMSSKGENWTKLGVAYVNLITENNDYEPASITVAQQWRTMFDLTPIYVVADPNFTFPASGLPHSLLADPRTMKIVDDLDNDPESTLNSDGSDPKVTALAKKNAVADGG